MLDDGVMGKEKKRKRKKRPSAAVELAQVVAP
jgi:hypothetical protein